MQLNPVVVKELRQAVRSKFVTTAMILFLLLQVVVMGVTLAETTVRSASYNQSNLHAGRNMFNLLVGIMTFTCMIFMPCYTGIRMAMERWGENMDLLYITTIKPATVIWGKMFAAAILTLLFFSITAPFMSFTYLLRGLDLFSVFIVVAFNYLVIYIATQIAVFFACLPTSRGFKVILVLGLLGCVAVACSLTIGGSLQLLSSGVGSSVKTREFWGAVSLVLCAGVSLCCFLHFLSVAIISPESSNRAFPVRVYITVIWIFWGVVACATAMHYSQKELIYAWLAPSIILLSFAFLAAVSEDDNLSVRVKRLIPRNMFKRTFAFFFYSGPAGGIAWVTVLMCLTFGITNFFLHSFKRGRFHMHRDPWYGFLALAIYVMAYSLTALFLRRILFKKFKPMITWVIVLMLMSFATSLPLILGLSIKKSLSSNVALWNMGNLFTLNKYGARASHLLFASVWAILAFALNIIWLSRQITAFKPWLSPVVEMEADTEQ